MLVADRRRRDSRQSVVHSRRHRHHLPQGGGREGDKGDLPGQGRRRLQRARQHQRRRLRRPSHRQDSHNSRCSGHNTAHQASRHADAAAAAAGLDSGGSGLPGCAAAWRAGRRADCDWRGSEHGSGAWSWGAGRPRSRRRVGGHQPTRRISGGTRQQEAARLIAERSACRPTLVFRDLVPSPKLLLFFPCTTLRPQLFHLFHKSLAYRSFAQHPLPSPILPRLTSHCQPVSPVSSHPARTHQPSVPAPAAIHPQPTNRS